MYYLHGMQWPGMAAGVVAPSSSCAILALSRALAMPRPVLVSLPLLVLVMPGLAPSLPRHLGGKANRRDAVLLVGMFVFAFAFCHHFSHHITPAIAPSALPRSTTLGPIDQNHGHGHGKFSALHNSLSRFNS